MTKDILKNVSKLLVLSIMLVVSCFISNVSMVFADTTKTMTELYDGINLTFIDAQENEEITISSKEELNLFSEYVNSSFNTENVTFKLTQDIVLTDDLSVNANFNTIASTEFLEEVDLSNVENWWDVRDNDLYKVYNETYSRYELISEDYDPNQTYYTFLAFKGTFDGQGYKISYINLSQNNEFNGLFGCINNATIKNLKLINGSASCENFGSIVGIANNSIIANCQSDLEINCQYSAGGIANTLLNSTLENCVFKGTINAERNIGGIVCKITDSIVKDCINQSQLKLTDGFTCGGIVSQIYYDCQVLNCVNYGEFSVSESSLIGGIAANCYVSSLIKNCKNYASIEGKENIGGIVGSCSSGITSNVFLEDCINYADILAINKVGGIIGINSTSGQILNCKSEGTVKGNSYIGGIVGQSYGQVLECQSSSEIFGSVFESTLPSLIGGIVGCQEYTEIANCAFIGEISSTGTNIGGITGKSRHTVLNCYVRADIILFNETSNIGGIIGNLLTDTNAKILNCYYVGIIDATNSISSNVNAICGYTDVENEENIINCFYNNDFKAVNGKDITENNVKFLDIQYMLKNEGTDSLEYLLDSFISTISRQYTFKLRSWKVDNSFPEFEIIKLTVSYDMNGGEGEVIDTNIYAPLQKVTVNFENKPTRPYYTFLGYSLHKTAISPLYYEKENQDTTFTIGQSNVILYAVWQKNEITDVTVNDIEVTYDNEFHSIEVLNALDGDVITYKYVGNDYSSENPEFKESGTYIVEYKITRENYFTLYDSATITINKEKVYFNDVVWNIVNDGNVYTASFDELSQKLLIKDSEQEIVDSFVYNNKNFEITLSNMPSIITNYTIHNNNFKDSGDYECYFDFDIDLNNYEIIGLVNKLSIKVEKVEVEIPLKVEKVSFFYTGQEISLNIPQNENYRILNQTAKSVGNYTAIISLLDVKNYVWVSEKQDEYYSAYLGTSKDIIIDYEIKKIYVPIIKVEEDTFDFDGNAHSIIFNESDLSFYEVYFDVLNNLAVNAGKYVVTLLLKDSSNINFVKEYKENNQYLDEDIIDASYYNYELTINKKVINVNTQSIIKEYIYTGNEIILKNQVGQSSEDLVSNALYDIVNGKNILVGNYSAKLVLLDKVNTCWQDNTNKDIAIDYKILPKKVMKPTISREYVYNGQEQILNFENENYIVLNNKATNAGTYEVLVSLVDTTNTCWSDGTVETLKFNWTIHPATIMDLDYEDIVLDITNNKKVIITFNGLNESGVLIEFSLDDKNHFSTEYVKITDDEVHKIYFRISKPNYKTIEGVINDVSIEGKKFQLLWVVLGFSAILIVFCLFLYLRLRYKRKLSFREVMEITKNKIIGKNEDDNSNLEQKQEIQSEENIEKNENSEDKNISQEEKQEIVEEKEENLVSEPKKRKPRKNSKQVEIEINEIAIEEENVINESNSDKLNIEDLNESNETKINEEEKPKRKRKSTKKETDNSEVINNENVDVKEGIIENKQGEMQESKIETSESTTKKSSDTTTKKTTSKTTKKSSNSKTSTKNTKTADKK